MKLDRCTRAWQAEALHDDRLSHADAASWRRHAASCATCRRELAALAQLAATAERMPMLTSTALEQRRLRHQLLRRAHAASVRAPRAPRLARLALPVSAALALLVAGGAWLWSLPASRRVAQPERRAALGAAPQYVAKASAGAVWHVRERGPTLRLALARGRLELEVKHLRSDQRFLVLLPDGELEVEGTRFAVQADGERTLGVHVIEGRVALRLDDHPWSLLAAGARFDAAPIPASPSVREPAPRPRPPRSRAGQPARVVEPAAEATARSTAEPAEQDVATEQTAVPPAESTFTRAMAAFSAGDFGQAEALFVRFERERPADTRVEDALFLRAVARDRRGDRAGARALAREYLDRFPNALRRHDAERMAR